MIAWAKADKEVNALTDAEVLSRFGCCPTDPDQARQILKNLLYNEYFQGYNDEVLDVPSPQPQAEQKADGIGNDV